MICEARPRSEEQYLHRRVSGAARDSRRGWVLIPPMLPLLALLSPLKLTLCCVGGELPGVVVGVVDDEDGDDAEVGDAADSVEEDELRRRKGNLNVGRR